MRQLPRFKFLFPLKPQAMKTSTGQKKSKAAPIKAKPTSAKKKVDTESKKHETGKKNGGGGKSKDGKSAEEKILEVLAICHARKQDPPNKDKIAKLANIAPKTLANTLPKLINKGFVEKGPNPQTILLTDAGVQHAGSVAKICGSNEEVHERIKSIHLTGKQVTLFEALSDGEIHEKDVIAKKLSYESKSTKAFVNLIGAVKSKGFVHYPTKDTIQLVEDVCFPLGMN
jgi:DNA-binding MarR family transcriptional regulator